MGATNISLTIVSVNNNTGNASKYPSLSSLVSQSLAFHNFKKILLESYYMLWTIQLLRNNKLHVFVPCCVKNFLYLLF